MPDEQTVPPDKNYFNKGTENAILSFQQEQDQETRNRIFLSDIKPAFDKLVENIVNVYHFHSIGNIDILRYDCVSMLFENLSKFDGSRGHKAFSYFNVIAKNWFIQRGKVAKKVAKINQQFDKSMLKHLETKSDSVAVPPPEHFALEEEFSILLKEEMRSWEQKFAKPQEQTVFHAVMHLLDNPEMPSLYNKKSVYLYLREMTNLNTKQIVTNLSKFRKRYDAFKKKYQAGKI